MCSLACSPFDHELNLTASGLGAVVLINKNAGGDYKQVGLHPVFVAVVYPAAMREILVHILLMKDHRDFDDEDSAYSRWLKFGVDVLGLGEPPEKRDDPDDNYEAVMEWVDAAANSFATAHGLLDRFKSFWTTEVST
jgi:hypothetical protein